MSTSITLTHWWRTTDRFFFTLVLLLIAVGVVLVMAASPSIADRYNLHDFYFAKRQFIFIGMAFIIMLTLSFFSPLYIRRIAVLGFLGALFLMLIVPIVGSEVKGAKRWIDFGFFSLQPSEFMKPFFIIVVAWLLSKMRDPRPLFNYRAPILLYLVIVCLLLIQPDIGMTITFSVVFGAQLFLAGLPIRYVVIAGLISILFGFFAYQNFNHVQDRIDAFLSDEHVKNYQVDRSIKAFESGGLFGRGPGEGVVKRSLPDSHTDFIFAVAGEEFGIVISMLIVVLYAAIIARGFTRAYQQKDRFIMIASGGLLLVFGFQAFVNMGVAVRLLPAKGMTLPFISYGGSSMLASAIIMGMVLALTRRQVHVKS